MKKGSVRKRGNKWYYYFYDSSGKKIERVAGDTKESAENELKKIFPDIENKNIILLDAIDEYFYKYKSPNLKSQTYLAEERLLNLHIKKDSNIANLPIKDITPYILQQKINTYKVRGYSKSSIVAIYCFMRGAFDYFYNMKWIESNPMNNVSIGMIKEEKEIHILTPYQIKRILIRFPINSNYYLPILLGYTCGLRIGETCGLRWKDIDLEKNLMYIRNSLQYSKDGGFIYGSLKTSQSERVLVIPKLLRKALEVKLENINPNPETQVCIRNDGKMFTLNTTKYMSRIINHELMINFRYHYLRHTHATMLVESGLNPKEIANRLGHSTVRTTLDIYTRYTEKMRINNSELIDELISDLLD